VILLFELMLLGFLFSLFYGWLVEFIVIKAGKLNEDHNTRVTITILLGISILSGLLAAWSFYWGIGTRALLFFSGGLLLSIVFTWKYILVRIRIIYKQLFPLDILSVAIFLVFLMYALYLASAGTPTSDSGRYHLQSIHWIEMYRIVPGLANLYRELGANSAIFLLAPFFGLSGLGIKAYQIPGLMLYIVLVGYSLSLIKQRFSPGSLMAWGILFFVLTGRFSIWLASPAADLPSAITMWLVFLLTLEKIETGDFERVDIPFAAIVLVSCFAFFIKLSAAPLCLIILYLGLKAFRSVSLKPVLTLIFLSVLIILPWLARTVVLTGYILYPFSKLDVFNFPWKVPVDVVNGFSTSVYAEARVLFEYGKSAPGILEWGWIPYWYSILPFYDRILIDGIMLCMALFVMYLVVNRSAIRNIKAYAIVYITGFLGVIFWFFQGPAPRYGYGSLVAFFCLLIASLAYLLLFRLKQFHKGFFLSMKILLLLFVAAAIYKFPPRSWKLYLYTYKSYPVVQTHPVPVDYLTLNIADGGICWYDAFPCASYKPSGLSMLGDQIEDGFYIKQK
jgi:hypothetical protein